MVYFSDMPKKERLMIDVELASNIATALVVLGVLSGFILGVWVGIDTARSE